MARSARLATAFHSFDEPERNREPSTPEAFRAAVHAALEQESLRGAQAIAAQGHARFPADPELARLHRLLTLPSPRSVKKPLAPDRTAAFQWLEENAADYRGQWVALSGTGLVASAPSFGELQRAVEALRLDNPPLALHVE